MKKIYIMAFVAMLFACNVIADNHNEFRIFTNMNNGKTLTALSKYLNTNNEQNEQLEYLLSLTDKKMKLALSNNNSNAAEKVKWFNLGNAKIILNEEQYKKYLLVLNVTLNSMNDKSVEDIAEN